ncbi:cholinesterase-like [Aphomia sociella]
MDSTIIFLFTFYIIQHVQSNILRLDPLVDSNAGLIRGLHATDGDYSMFLGIPYARVNESNPFGISTPEEKFQEVYEAYDDSSMLCPQYQSNEPVGNLDCLQLNIYVPNSANSQNRLPVMIWIHGGTFRTGSGRTSESGPKYLVKHNIILVSINYRLGPYGFMCLETSEVPGNQGLKDQLLALRWIRDNIEAFGGDVNKITLSGHSAGSISIDLHLLSSHDNLFNRVIMQSGTSLASSLLQTLDEPDKSAPMKLAEYLGYQTDSITEGLNVLARTDSNLVIAASNALGIIFKPCVEKEYLYGEPFITEHWVSAEIRKVKGIPILIGFNSNERTSEYVNKESDFYDNLNVFNDKLVQTFSFDNNELIKFQNIVQHFYMGDNKTSIEFMEKIGNFDSDLTYIHPIQRSIRKYLERSAENIFYYMLSYSGDRNIVKRRLNVTVEGAFHGDEIGYLFDLPNLPEDNPQDLLVIEQMTTMWANFVKFG